MLLGQATTADAKHGARSARGSKLRGVIAAGVIAGSGLVLAAPPSFANGGAGAGGTARAPSIPGARFSHPTSIDNKWLPLVPGTQFVYVGTANRGQGQGTHRVVFTVTDISKEIDGVRSLVVWDRDFQDGELVEAELSFWAQDDEGTVWNMGEYPEEWEDGELVGADSTWLTGVQRAHAGIHMQAHPHVGTPAYSQGRAPAIDFFDKAKVAAEHQRDCVPVACYANVLVVDEWNPLEQPQDGHQLKSHAPGVGIVKIDAVGGVEQETLVLAKYEQLTPAAFAEARAKVFKLDQRAYTLARAVWKDTPPAELGL
jgi:hypothetical protein